MQIGAIVTNDLGVTQTTLIAKQIGAIPVDSELA